MRVLYQGLLHSPASWARVGRGYVGAFARLGVDFGVVAPRGFLHDPGFQLPSGVRELSAAEARSMPEPEVGLGFLHPPLAERIIGRKKVSLFVWESDFVPPEWVESFDRHLDLVVVPSRFSRDALVRSGLGEEKVAVIAYGHDVDDAQTPAGAEGRRAAAREPHRSRRPFTILSVVSPHWRKGIRELLTAYRKSFRSSDDVLLRLKTTYDPGESRRRRPFEIPSWKEVLGACGLDSPGSPPVEIDLSRVSDVEVLELYGEADVYVQATWGESFGLALLEAAASGLPTLATGWGGQVDFLPPGDDLLPYRLEVTPEGLYEAAPGAQVAIPDVEALAARLTWHREHREASRNLGAEAREAVRGMTWLESARHLLVQIL